MKREVGVVETGLEEFSLKRICASSVTTKNRSSDLAARKRTSLRTIVDPPLVINAVEPVPSVSQLNVNCNLKLSSNY